MVVKKIWGDVASLRVEGLPVLKIMVALLRFEGLLVVKKNGCGP